MSEPIEGRLADRLRTMVQYTVLDGDDRAILRQAADRIAELEARNRDLKRLCDESAQFKRIDQLQIELTDAEGRIAELEAHVIQLSERRDENQEIVRSAIAGKNARIAELEAELKHWQNDWKHWRLNLSMKDEQVRKAEARIEQLEREKAALTDLIVAAVD